jgi:aspartyl-tRNA(Asn)/glutamyl-tRNA(Gln) amidotransferase subunit C
MLSEKDVTHLAELARLALSPAEKKALLNDLEKILAHFEELKTVDTEGVPPVAGGTTEKNVVREDVAGAIPQALSGVEAFPESQSGFLKIPPVFGE